MGWRKLGGIGKFGEIGEIRRIRKIWATRRENKKI